MTRRGLLLLLLGLPVVAEEGWVTHAVALAPDLKTVVRGRMHAERGTSRIRIEDAVTNEVRFEGRWSGPIRAFAFRGDSARFAATSDHGSVKVLDAAGGEVVAELAGPRGWVHTVAFAGGRVAAAGYEDGLRVWDAATGKELWHEPQAKVGAVALTPDGKLLAQTDNLGRVHLWDVATAKKQRTLDIGDNRWIFQVAFAPDGRRLAAGAKAARVWEVSSGRVLATLAGHAQRVTALAFSPDGTKLATADRASTVRVWDLATGKAERTWPGKHYVGALAFATDGRTLGAAFPYAPTRRYKLRDG